VSFTLAVDESHHDRAIAPGHAARRTSCCSGAVQDGACAPRWGLPPTRTPTTGRPPLGSPGAISNAIITNLGTSSSAAIFDGFIRNNVIGKAGVALSCSTQANGIEIDAHGNGNHILSVTNNTIKRCFDRGILVLANDGNGQANLTITGNTVNELDDTNATTGTPREAVHTSTGATSTNVFSQIDSHAVCVNLSNNTLDGNLSFVGEDVRLRQRFRTSIRLPGYGGSAFDSAAVKTFVEGNNPGGEVVSATFTNDAGVTTDGYFGGAACTQPS
jgi:hypothetical protein